VWGEFLPRVSFGGLARRARFLYHICAAMKRSSFLILIGLAVLGLAAALAASILHDGLSSRAKPSVLEAAITRNAHHLAIPSSARSAQNPVLATAEDLRDARLHFADHCAICHGNDGSGHAMIGEGLYPPPPDLRKPATQNLSDGELFWIIENGVRFTGMPAFAAGGQHGGEPDSWKLVHFIRHLPHLSAEERLEMERYNPKGPEDRAEEQQENEFLDGATQKAKPESQKHHP
jgi:mono/diheme cytochrome c family protein